MARRGAILFDLDGTLVDSALGIAQALTALRERRGGGPIASEAVRPWISLGVNALVANALGPLAGANDVADFRAILQNIPADRACIHPGVESALDVVVQAGWTLAIVTNKPEDLSRKLLADLGLGDRFAAIIGGDTTPHAKPHPAPVEHALRALDVASDRAVYVGDSEVDAAAARATGLPFLLYAGGYGADACRDADVRARFASFGDLPDLLDRPGMMDPARARR